VEDDYSEVIRLHAEAVRKRPHDALVHYHLVLPMGSWATERRVSWRPCCVAVPVKTLPTFPTRAPRAHRSRGRSRNLRICAALVAAARLEGGGRPWRRSHAKISDQPPAGSVMSTREQLIAASPPIRRAECRRAGRQNQWLITRMYVAIMTSTLMLPALVPVIEFFGLRSDALPPPPLPSSAF
jgi:hypothetical protein